MLTTVTSPFIPSGRLASARAPSSHDQIARALGADILAGTYAPGAILPPEAQLLARFKVSRTVLREVIKTLTAKGFVQPKTRVGTRVLDPVHWNFFDAEVLAWKVSLGPDADFSQSLTEIRLAVEPEAAALAARRRTPADIQRLRGYLAAMAAPECSRQQFVAADLDFHTAIGGASGNPLMRSIAGVIEVALVASFAAVPPAERAAREADSIATHTAVVDAIEAGDADLARARMAGILRDPQ
jgi:DNA-binding FadR family transcriptional regulator